MTNPTVPFVTETGTAHWTSCTEASMVMAANWADPAIPATVAERQALQAVGAHTPNGGRTQAMIMAAMQSRWGHRPNLAGAFDSAVALLQEDYVLAIAGNYHNLPKNLQRWDVPFAARTDAWHEVCVGPIAPGDTTEDPLVWWRDPLGRGTYRGEWVRWSVVTAFALSPGDILAFAKGGWSMVPFTVTGPGGGTGTLLADPTIRLIDLEGAGMVVPAAKTYVLGPAGTLGGAHPGPAHIATQAGKLVALLDRNMTIAPVAAPVSSGLAHWELTDGVLTVHSA